MIASRYRSILGGGLFLSLALTLEIGAGEPVRGGIFLPIQLPVVRATEVGTSVTVPDGGEISVGGSSYRGGGAGSSGGSGVRSGTIGGTSVSVSAKIITLDGQGPFSAENPEADLEAFRAREEARPRIVGMFDADGTPRYVIAENMAAANEEVARLKETYDQQINDWYKSKGTWQKRNKGLRYTAAPPVYPAVKTLKKYDSIEEAQSAWPDLRRRPWAVYAIHTGVATMVAAGAGFSDAQVISQAKAIQALQHNAWVQDPENHGKPRSLSVTKITQDLSYDDVEKALAILAPIAKDQPDALIKAGKAIRPSP